MKATITGIVLIISIFLANEVGVANQEGRTPFTGQTTFHNALELLK